MTAVMLKPTWPGTFHRGALTFIPGVPVTVDDLQLEAIKGDLGKALVYCKVEEDGTPTGKAAKDQDHAANLAGVTVAPQAEQPRRGGRRGR